MWNLTILLMCYKCADGMGTAEWRAAKNPAYYKRGDYVPGLKVGSSCFLEIIMVLLNFMYLFFINFIMIINITELRFGV